MGTIGGGGGCCLSVWVAEMDMDTATLARTTVFFFVVVGRVDVGFLDGKRRGVVGWGVYTVLDHAGGRGPARWPLRTLTDGSPSSVSR